MWRMKLATLAIKNTLWLVLGTGFSKLLKLILIVFAARMLGVDEYGKLTFAFGFVSLLMILSDLGFSSIVTREFAVEGRTEKDFSALLSLKLLLTMGAFLIMAFMAAFLYEASLVRTILLLAAAGVLSGFGTFFYSLFQAKQRMEYQALATFFESALVTALGFFILFTAPSANDLASAYLLGSAIALMGIAVFFHRAIYPVKLAFDLALWKSFLHMAWPMAVVLLFSTVYFDLTSVMLGMMRTLEETGWYNAGYRPVTVVFIGLNLISLSFFPALSAAFSGSREKWQSLWNVEFRLLFSLIVPIVVGGMMLAPRIIGFLYGPEFGPATLSFRLTLLTVGILVLFIPMKDMLVAAHQQKKALMVVVLTAVLTIVLNLVLVPRYGMSGALLSTLIASFTGVLTAWIFTPVWIQVPRARPLFGKPAFFVLVSATIMALALSSPLVSQFPVMMLVLFGAVLYVFSLVLLTKIKGYKKPLS